MNLRSRYRDILSEKEGDELTLRLDQDYKGKNGKES